MSAPILLHYFELEALRAGRLRQLRRPLEKAHDPDGTPAGSVCAARESGWIAWWPHRASAKLEAFTKEQYREGFECPFGRTGDTLWVQNARRPSHRGRAALLFHLVVLSVAPTRLHDASQQDWIDLGCPREYLAPENWYYPNWDSAHPEFLSASNPWTWKMEVRKR